MLIAKNVGCTCISYSSTASLPDYNDRKSHAKFCHHVEWLTSLASKNKTLGVNFSFSWKSKLSALALCPPWWQTIIFHERFLWGRITFQRQDSDTLTLVLTNQKSSSINDLKQDCLEIRSQASTLNKQTIEFTIRICFCKSVKCLLKYFSHSMCLKYFLS